MKTTSNDGIQRCAFYVVDPAQAVVRCLAVCFSLLLVEHAAADTQRITPAEYKSHIERQRQSVESMLVSFESHLEFDEETLAAGRLAGRTHDMKVTVAFARGKGYAQRQWTGYFSDNQRYEDEMVSVFTGTDNRIRTGKKLQVQADKSAYSELNTYLSGLLWPRTEAELEECRANPGESHYLPYFLEAPGWEVQEREETIRGVSCVVLARADGRQTLWLDPRRGYAMIRYEHLNPFENTVKWTVDYDDFREVLPDFFLPWSNVGTHDMIDAKTKEPYTLRAVLTVSQLQVNDVPESLFTLEPQEGEFVIDRVQRTSYRHRSPGDGTLLDGVEEARMEMSRSNPTANASGRFFFTIMAVAFAVFTSGAIVRIAVRWRKRKG